MSDHRMRVAGQRPGEVLYVCDECGRRLVDHRDRGITVIDQGDFWSTHSGSTAGLTMGQAEVEG